MAVIHRRGRDAPSGPVTGIHVFVAALSIAALAVVATASPTTPTSQTCFAPSQLLGAASRLSAAPALRFGAPNVAGRSLFQAEQPRLRNVLSLSMADAGASSTGIFNGINDAVKTAMKARESQRLQALRGIKAALQAATKVKNVDVLPDDECVPVLRKLAKQRVESIEAFSSGGREEMAEGERFELAIIEEYLPSLADEATTRKWIDEAVAETGSDNAGKLMGALMKGHKDEMDGALAKRILDEMFPGGGGGQEGRQGRQGRQGPPQGG